MLGEGGAEQPKAEVQALQIVIPAEPPSVVLYTELAQYAYQAGNTRQGDLAAEKAIALAPKIRTCAREGRAGGAEEERWPSERDRRVPKALGSEEAKIASRRTAHSALAPFGQRGPSVTIDARAVSSTGRAGAS